MRTHLLPPQGSPRSNCCHVCRARATGRTLCSELLGVRTSPCNNEAFVWTSVSPKRVRDVGSGPTQTRTWFCRGGLGAAFVRTGGRFMPAGTPWLSEAQAPPVACLLAARALDRQPVLSTEGHGTGGTARQTSSGPLGRVQPGDSCTPVRGRTQPVPGPWQPRWPSSTGARAPGGVHSSLRRQH